MKGEAGGLRGSGVQGHTWLHSEFKEDLITKSLSRGKGEQAIELKRGKEEFWFTLAIIFPSANWGFLSSSYDYYFDFVFPFSIQGMIQQCIQRN